jgi:hypothetical protein
MQAHHFPRWKALLSMWIDREQCLQRYVSPERRCPDSLMTVPVALQIPTKTLSCRIPLVGDVSSSLVHILPTLLTQMAPQLSLTTSRIRESPGTMNTKSTPTIRQEAPPTTFRRRIGLHVIPTAIRNSLNWLVMSISRCG